MSSQERLDILLSDHLSGQLTTDTAEELRQLLLTEPEALDQYLDACELVQALSNSTSKVDRNVTTVAKADPTTFRHFLTWSVAAVAVVVVGVIAPQSSFVTSPIRVASVNISDPRPTTTAAIEAPNAAAGNVPSRRSPNPWKVIQSTGSMNHPALTVASIPEVQSAKDRPLQFNRDIRPILSETCFHCHGPDEHGRRADLRLDTLEGATEDLGGYQPIVPGDLESSEAWNRITSDDPDLLMPPPESHLVLTAEQKTLLKRWIEEGAVYEGHWAFIPPAEPKVPQVDFEEEGSDSNWVRNDLDRFVAQRLAEAGMVPSPEADPRTLIRRLTLDLTGLPPSPDEVERFVSDYQPDGEPAYEETVNRLLRSPHFGERMALPWLDQARYADTNGYSIDGGRHMWLWRDWVIQAYNDNMPFDQFLMEQLAGDLLPNATASQRIATGFNRNHMITHEGGTIPEENLTNYTADRVKTTSEVFLGLTMGCAQCHDHKYDLISQREYYEFFAFFNELEDRGLDGNAGRNAAPQMQAQTVLKTDELESLQTELQQLHDELATTTEGLDRWLKQQRKTEQNRGDQFALVPIELQDVSSPNMRGDFDFSPDGTVTIEQPSGGLNGMSHSLRLATGEDSQLPIHGLRIVFQPRELPPKKTDDVTKEPTPPQMALTPFAGSVPKVTTILVSATQQPAEQVDYHSQVAFDQVTASSQPEGHPADSVLTEDNSLWWQPADGQTEQHLTLTFDRPIDPKQTPFMSVLLVFGQNQSMPFQWQVQPFTGNDTDSRWSDSLIAAIQEEPATWDDAKRATVLQAFRKHSPELRPLRVRVANLEERVNVLTAAHSTMVMNTATKPRETFVLDRGQYDSPTDRVTPQVPRVLPELSSESSTRLDLAKWLIAPEHPLTSRVAVNRLWALFFGTGLVATSADFGSQGEYPSHPELLDHLATQFVQSGWNQKELIRQIVGSATYRQQSRATAEQLELDPQNRLLARGPRFRLPAEFIRDQALAVSQLLVPRIGGPSVQPYQPPALWKEVSHFGSTPATKQVFVQDHGEKLYRRSLYTIVKRTSPHPAMSAFDAPSREMCVMQRGATNTPIQALVTLNDPQFAEAARALAERLLTGDDTDSERVERAYQIVLGRAAKPAEQSAMKQFLLSQRERFSQSPNDAAAAISVGESPRSEQLDPVEHAAWMQVASLMLNLSETLTRL
ncbi:PSD1 and planctomycete cytochrome C domain-containing protein [Rhodopirellula halodulae]|uniref:PSD1 and planctomycete cytochrome C domain-containing protein n=1 Tax=Rhodopirellula halodulae TaxID=2894198 RepID=UPI001E328837|nr:PSD1 and planctomycete cytochrome C domain-containing protein [Rhodopirellula sp. JC737]MCC9654793.1 PSD1 and planctomycete cytochrome C domain-containing protein [Rhodopirellula sp. JC737]